MLHLIYRCFDIYILCLTCVGIFICHRGLGQISEMMLGYSLTLENICDRWSGRINVLVEKASEEADLWPSATWYAKSLTIGFEASLHKKLHKCPADVSLTCWWHSVYGWYLQFHETSTLRSGPDRGQIKFRLTATSHLPPIYFYVFVGKNSGATKWRGCPPFVVTADLKMFLWMRASCPLVSKLIDLPDSSTV